MTSTPPDGGPDDTPAERPAPEAPYQPPQAPYQPDTNPPGAPPPPPAGYQPTQQLPAQDYPAPPPNPQYGAPPPNPQYGGPQYGAPQYGAPPPNPQYGAPQYGAPQYGADPYAAAQPGQYPGSAPGTDYPTSILPVSSYPEAPTPGGYDPYGSGGYPPGYAPPPPAGPGGAPQRPRKRWPWVVGGVALLAVVGVVVGLLASGGSDNKSDTANATGPTSFPSSSVVVAPPSDTAGAGTSDSVSAASTDSASADPTTSSAPTTSSSPGAGGGTLVSVPRAGFKAKLPCSKPTVVSRTQTEVGIQMSTHVAVCTKDSTLVEESVLSTGIPAAARDVTMRTALSEFTAASNDSKIDSVTFQGHAAMEATYDVGGDTGKALVFFYSSKRIYLIASADQQTYQQVTDSFQVIR